MSAYSAERILTASAEALARFYKAGAEALRAEAAAYRMRARHARLNPYRTPEANASEAEHLETMARQYDDMADETEADALGEAA